MSKFDNYVKKAYNEIGSFNDEFDVFQVDEEEIRDMFKRFGLELERFENTSDSEINISFDITSFDGSMDIETLINLKQLLESINGIDTVKMRINPFPIELSFVGDVEVI